MSEGQAVFPSKVRQVAIITTLSMCLWQTSSKGGPVPLGTTCDDRVRVMWKPVFTRNATGGQHVSLYSHISTDVSVSQKIDS